MLPPAGTRGMSAGPSSGGLFLEDEVGSFQPAAGLQQPLEKQRGDRKRGVGHDPVRPPRQPEVRSICLDDHQIGSKSEGELTGSVGMSFDGDDSSAELEESRADHALTGTDIEDQIAGPDPRISYEACRPSGVKLVPTPVAWGRGHGCGPSRT